MIISEIFNSIQGEGIDIGIPSMFIRLAGCNLKCSWCDTKYSQNPKEGDTIEENALARIVLNNQFKVVTFTGGEPMLQSQAILKTIELVESIQNNILVTMPQFVIETNGTMYNDKLMSHIDRWNISPKLSSSGNSDCIRDDILKKYLKYPDKIQFKFVISSHDDMLELMNILHNIPKIKKSMVPITIQPQIEKMNLSSYRKKCQEIISKYFTSNFKDFQDYNIAFIIQQHKVIWGNSKGV